VLRVKWLAAAVLPPSVAAGAFGHSIIEHPIFGGAALVLYELILSLLKFLGPINKELQKRWQERISDSLDKALVRRLSRFGQQYREFVIANLRFIDTKGLATAGFYTPRLDEVFLDINISYMAPHDISEGLLSQEIAHASERLSLKDFLNRPESVVLAILGSPGSGKTTLMRHTALSICRDGRRRLRRKVPVILDIRDHFQEVTANPKISLVDVVRDTLGILKEQEPTGWLESRLRAGDCVIMLDGLDEVSENEDRKNMIRWINSQVRQNFKNDFLITSRPLGYGAATIEGALVLQVRSLTAGQVSKFVQDWYRAVERPLPSEPATNRQQRADSKSGDLVQQITNASNLYDLTANPLLLTIIVNVHSFRGVLPNNRLELYKEICQSMLWGRQEAKEIPVEPAGHIREAILCGLAFSMMRRRVHDLSPAQMAAEIRPVLRRKNVQLSAEEYLSDMRANGMIVERASGQLAFVHHTFQEYMAAAHILQDKRRTKILLESIEDVWWRETTLFFAAGSDANQIIESCFNSGGLNALSLAADWVDQGIGISSTLRARLDELIGSALASEADASRRKILSRLLLARHLRSSVIAADNVRVGTKPVTNRVYGRYVANTANPTLIELSQTHLISQSSSLDQPFIGADGTDALGFASWANKILGGDRIYGLPSRDQMSDSTVQRALGDGTLCYWLQPEQGSGECELWIPTGVSHPYSIHSTTLRSQALEDVVLEGGSIARLVIVRSILAARMLLLDGVLDRTHGAQIDYLLGEAFKNDRSSFKDMDLDWADALRRTHSMGLDRTEDRALMFARALDHDRIIDSEQAVDHARAVRFDSTDHEAGLNALLSLDRLLTQAIGVDRASSLDEMMRQVVGRAFSQALAKSSFRERPDQWLVDYKQEFAIETIEAESVFIVAPGSLAERIAATNTTLREVAHSSSSHAGQLVRNLTLCLEKSSQKVFGSPAVPLPRSYSSARLAALCLSSEAQSYNRSDLTTRFREIAAGLALHEFRRDGRNQPNEGIILVAR
jgi:hypothetical protein